MVTAPIEFTPRKFDQAIREVRDAGPGCKPHQYQKLYNELEAAVNGWATFDEMKANADGNVRLARIPNGYFSWSRIPEIEQTTIVFYNAEFDDVEGRQEVGYVIDRHNNIQRRE